jgi:hypothetical protein
MMVTFPKVFGALWVGGCAVMIVLGALATASPVQAQTNSGTPRPGARFASEATSRQNAVIDAAMSKDPGGTRVSPGEVRWPNGVNLVVETRTGAVAPDDYEDCPAGYFCAYPGTLDIVYPGVWYEIPNYVLHGSVYFYAWGACITGPGCGLGIGAWANNTGQRVWLEQFQNSGQLLCISNQTHNYDYTGPDDEDYWIYLSSNKAACS